jgi:Core-2/I-Branching enzyme
LNPRRPNVMKLNRSIESGNKYRRNRQPLLSQSHWSHFSVLFACFLLTTFSATATDKPYQTLESKLRRKIHVNLSDHSLTANDELDLTKDAADAAKQVLTRLSGSLQDRLSKLYERAVSPECRALIGEHLGYFINAIGTERPLPFSDMALGNQCPEEIYDFDNLPEGMHFGMVQNKTYQPEGAVYIQPDKLKLCYAILTHDAPKSTIRLVEALYEPGHIFVIHVDAKEVSEPSYEVLAEYAASRDYITVLPHPYRVRVNWGGHSMVNATMQILQYLFGLNGHTDGVLDFDKVVHMASTSYPIASNARIRQTIASYPLDANLMHVIMKPTNPHPGVWHYFVECDDQLHRLYRLKPLSIANGGIELYTSSQWFIISRDFSYYLALAKPGTLVHALLEYNQHVVVADESFFGTVLRNSPFCDTHHNWNFLHLQFDRWESDLDSSERDERKCIMPDPNHCGRSPTTLTMDYVDILELTGDLFARKFDPNDEDVKTILDARRAIDDAVVKGQEIAKNVWNSKFEGHGVLIVAKETIQDDVPLCMGLGESKNNVRLVPCFHEGIPSTLAKGWETGGVIEEETMLHNRWELGPCSSDGKLERHASADMLMTPGEYSPVGPRCMLTQIDGLRAGRCVDGEMDRLQPGGDLHVFPCMKKWNQFLSVGNGTLAPRGSLHTTIPRHIVDRIQYKGYEQESFLCVGVLGRGDHDEEAWAEDLAKRGMTARVDIEVSASIDTLKTLPPWSNFNGVQLVTTRCSNIGAIVEWVYVPFIVENENEAEESQENIEETVKVEGAERNNEL